MALVAFTALNFALGFAMAMRLRHSRWEIPIALILGSALGAAEAYAGLNW